MKRLPKIIFERETELVFKTEDASIITRQFLKDFNWPPNIKWMGFVFDRPVEDTYEMATRLSPDYTIQFAYSLPIKNLVEENAAACSSISAEPIKNFDHLKQLSLATHEGYYNEFKKYTGEQNRQEFNVFIEKYLPTAKVGYWEACGKPAALITMIRWNDYADILVDWIAWIWIDKNISQEERKSIHCHINKWLTTNVNERVECKIGYYNIRSQRFFRKLGFQPTYIFIKKNS